MSTKVRIHFNDDASVEISGLCTVTRRLYFVTVPYSAYAKWQSGALVQDAFPNLDSWQREFLISGTTPGEWNQLDSEDLADACIPDDKPGF